MLFLQLSENKIRKELKAEGKIDQKIMGFQFYYRIYENNVADLFEATEFVIWTKTKISNACDLCHIFMSRIILKYNF